MPSPDARPQLMITVVYATSAGMHDYSWSGLVTRISRRRYERRSLVQPPSQPSHLILLIIGSDFEPVSVTARVVAYSQILLASC